MENEKNSPSDREMGAGEAEATEAPAMAPRARNRTVMLTPEITGQVRARLAQDFGHGQNQPPVRGAETTQPTPDYGNVSASGGSFYSAQGRGRPVVQPEAQSAPEPRGGRPIPQQPQRTDSREGLVWQKKTPVVGFLVSYDVNPAGDVYDLRSGRLIVTSESAGQGNYLLIKDESVSPMHAILRISASGEVQVLDQLSEFGTRIKRFGSDDEKELSGDKGTVEHGDIVSFGNRKFHVCMIANPPEG
jgi:hypothetical protein